MPKPDPVPGQRAAAARRFKRIMARMALVSLLASIVAVLAVGRGNRDVPIPILIATFFGVGLTMLLGTALMSLAFLSSSSGHDEDVQHPEKP